MRITLLSQYYPPERGAVRYAKRLAEGLSRDGCEVTVVAGLPHFPAGSPHPEFGRFRPNVQIESGIRVVRLPLVMGSNRQTWRRLAGFATFSLSVCAWFLTCRRPDVVIASVPPATTAVPAWMAARVRRSRLIVLLRDIEPLRSLNQRGFGNAPWARWLIACFMWIYRRADRVVVVHPREVDRLNPYRIDPRRIRVIPHGIDVADTVDVPAAAVVRRRPQRHVALYAGTFGLVHGLTTLLESLSDPSIRSMPVDFWLIGDGQFRPDCERMVADRGLEHVHIGGPVPEEKVPGLLREADLLICSYRNEDDVPLGAKFYECCAAGRPILVHGRNEAARLVREIGNGLWCEAGAVAELERALQQYLDDPAFWRERGKLGRAYALAHFRQSARDTQWRSLMRELFEEGAPSQ